MLPIDEQNIVQLFNYQTSYICTETHTSDFLRS